MSIQKKSMGNSCCEDWKHRTRAIDEISAGFHGGGAQHVGFTEIRVTIL